MIKFTFTEDDVTYTMFIKLDNVRGFVIRSEEYSCKVLMICVGYSEYELRSFRTYQEAMKFVNKLVSAIGEEVSVDLGNVREM